MKEGASKLVELERSVITDLSHCADCYMVRIWSDNILECSFQTDDQYTSQQVSWGADKTKPYVELVRLKHVLLTLAQISSVDTSTVCTPELEG